MTTIRGRAQTNPVPTHLNSVLFNPIGWASLRFRPDRRAQTLFVRNPYRVASRSQGKALSASFLMGLASGRGPRRKFTPDQVRRAIMRWFPSGGSIILQLGWYAGSKEDSIRVTIENSGTGFSERGFVSRVKRMLGAFVDEFVQQEIWLDVYRAGEIIQGYKTFWVKK